MNKRSYYVDSYTVDFSTAVSESIDDGQRKQIVLDHTYFYPSSGGQPNDLGSIDNIPVIDVIIRERDGAVLHVLERLPKGDVVVATIDWPRRFDHMQQHTGQHILSQAFIETAGAQTVGFHLSSDTLTIDLDQEQIDDELIAAAEDLANQIVWQNRPVVVRWATRQEAQEMHLRKIPANGDEKLRLIDIIDFDLTACGGTHVSRTGEVGLIKVIRQESRNKKTRIHFRCGGRALEHYQELNQIVQQLTAQLTTGANDLAPSVSRLQEKSKQANKSIKRLQADLDRLEAGQLLSQGSRVGETTLVMHVLDEENSTRARALAGRLAEHEHVIALIGTVGRRVQLVFSRSAETPGDMNRILQIALQELESGSGGGSESFAQGAAQAATEDTVKQALEKALSYLVQERRSVG